MTGRGARVAIAELAAAQWGLLTAAQATVAGVTRMMLSRMTASGELERVIHGVYATPAAARGELADRRALWLSLEPDRLAHERLAESPPVGVISHASAAAVHGLGDIPEPHVEVTLPARYRTRRAELRTHRGELRPDEVMVVDGLPVTTTERTIADLLRDGHDLDHVATATREALMRGQVAAGRLEAALDGPVRPGREALRELLEAAGIDPERLAAAVVASPLGAIAVQETARRMVEQMAPFAEYHRALQRQLGYPISAAAANLAPVDQVRAALQPTTERMAELAAVALKVQLPASYLNSAAALRDTTETWRRMVLAQRTAESAEHLDGEEPES